MNTVLGLVIAKGESQVQAYLEKKKPILENSLYYAKTSSEE
ncbi:hypothetical protein [Heyndrickxia acidicola]|uniref:Uncharacterized protein n=1 Tax=Heyndrickxia acidicola TaxID=209389 RepID=A0ABU6MC27_9BACI|nr:hypothetical protein [Heyndrickxia acidicola]MED1202227.1 hypothetical protein [Heyndrickxia acidicola]